MRLVVVGYGGWDDIFMEALVSAASNEHLKLDVLWAFHQENLETVIGNYGHVLDPCRPLLDKYRFRAFLAIDVHELLQSLALRIAEPKHHSANRAQGTTPEQVLSRGVRSTLDGAGAKEERTEGPQTNSPPQPSTVPVTNADEERDDSVCALWMAALADPSGHLGYLARDAIKTLQETAPTLFASPVTSAQALLLKPYQGRGYDCPLPFHDRRHVLVAEPTSSGKSTLAEMFLVRPPLLNQNKTLSIYIAPTRALAQAKFHDLQLRLRNLPQLARGLILSTGEDNSGDWRLNHAAFSPCVRVVVA